MPQPREDPAIQRLREMPEPRLHTEIIIPLLRAMGMRNINYLHGAFERGKDILYTQLDSYGDDVLVVCQVKNEAFHGRASERGNTAEVLSQLAQCRHHEVLNPATSLKQQPQQVVFITTWPVSDRDTADGGLFLSQLRRDNVKIIGPDRLLELIQKHLRSAYDELITPGRPLASHLRDIVNRHNESHVLRTSMVRDLDTFYVDLSLQAPAGLLTDLCAGRIAAKRSEIERYLNIDTSIIHSLLIAEKALPFSFGKGWIRFDGRYNDRESAPQTSFTLTLDTIKDLADIETIAVRFSSKTIINSIQRHLATEVSNRNPPHSKLEVLAALSTFLTELHHDISSHLFSHNVQETDGVSLDVDVKNVDVGSLLQFGNNLCIVGDAGAGKTSLARAVAREAIFLKRKVCYFPCSRLTSEDMDLKSEMRRYLDSFAPPGAKDEVQEYMDTCDLIIIDGCDEAATLRSTLWSDISGLANKKYPYNAQIEGKFNYPVSADECFEQSGRLLVQTRGLTRYEEAQISLLNNTAATKNAIAEMKTAARSAYPQVIVTCRESAPIDLGPNFVRLRLCPFSDLQLEQFFKGWFRKQTERADEVLTYLRKPENARILEVCRTPIVASILASLHEHGTPLPQSKTEVYERRFELLLERWQQSKSVKIHRSIPTRHKQRYIAELALQVHKRHGRHFTKGEACAVWDKLFSSAFRTVDINDLLDELCIYDNVITRDADDLMSLGHLSYQEYLTAWALLCRQQGKWLARFLHDSWWREVLLFFAGLTGSVAEIFESAMAASGLPKDPSLVSDLNQEALLTPHSIADFVKDFSEDDESIDDLDEDW